LVKLKSWRFFSVIIALILVSAIAIIALPARSGLSAAAVWNLQQVDTNQIGTTSIALDSSGNPHISYYKNSDRNLKYASWNGSAWVTEAIDTYKVGEFCSLALDSNNNPHISYYDSGNHDLKYIHWNGSAWVIEVVDSADDVGRYTSIALDSSNRPHISYSDDTNTSLKYARWNGSAWIIQTVDDVANGAYYTSIALDSSNNPHISYQDEADNYDLKYAQWNGSAWVIQVVDSAGEVGANTSLALDSSNRPHISYYDGTNQSLKYAHWNGSAWVTETVETGNQVGNRSTSIAMDSFKKPHISYNDETNRDVKYARWTGSAWAIEVVADISGGLDIPSTSLALSRCHYPHISYSTAGGTSLHYAYVSPSAPTIISVTPASGSQRQTLAVTITGTNFAGATAVTFGDGITVSGFTVNSDTQITANIVISATAKIAPRDVSVTVCGGKAIKEAAFRVTVQSIGTNTPAGSTTASVTPPAPPMPLSNIVVQGASLSTTTVSPNTPVTVTADIANKSTVNGNKKVTVYVNGEIETTQGIALDSGSTSKLTFNVSRSEPGTYKVYVDGTPAGSFKVEAVTASDTILIVSAAFLAIAFVCGLIMLRRRQSAGR
jgi:hypothetical protein